MGLGRVNSPVPEAAGPAIPRHGVRYDGRGVSFLGLLCLNALLSFLTLTVYRFWGKTRVRRFIWGGVSFLDDRFEYTGRPVELLIGFLIVAVVLIPLILIYVFVSQYIDPLSSEALIAQYIVAGVFVFLVQFAVYRARRYRLSRTEWRGIRGRQTGSAANYAARTFLLLLLMGATLWLALPVKNVMLYRYRITNTRFGDREFRFRGSAEKLMVRWIICWLLFIPTLGFSYFWYKAGEIRYFARTTTYEVLSFESRVSGGGLLWAFLPPYVVGVVIFAISSIFLWSGLGLTVDLPVDIESQEDLAEMITLQMMLLFALFGVLLATVFGIVRLYTNHLFVRVFCRRLSVVGEQDFGLIAQSARAAPRFGEGLADALDVGGL